MRDDTYYDALADAKYDQHRAAKREQWRGRIDVEYVNPPIPLRTCDYRATLKGYEPGEAQGWGRTADEAIDHLIEQVEEDEE